MSNRKSTTDGQEPATKLKREPASKLEATAYRSAVGVQAKKNTAESIKAPDRRRSLRSAVKGMDKISVADDSKALVPKTGMGAKKPTTKSQAIAVVAKKRKPCAAIAAKKVVQTVKRGRSSVKEQEEPPRKRTRRSTKSGMETLVVGKKAEVVKKVGPVPTASRPKKRATTDSGTDGKPSQIEPRELCTDFLAETDYSMVRKPFDNTKYTFGLSLHDEKHKDNVLMVADYVTDMFQRLYHAEVSTLFCALCFTFSRRSDRNLRVPNQGRKSAVGLHENARAHQPHDEINSCGLARGSTYEIPSDGRNSLPLREYY